MGARSLVWQSLLAAAAFALLLTLGVWQLRRLEWKESLISHIETRTTAAPTDPPLVGEWPRLRGEDYDYRHVRAEGRFDLAKKTQVFAQAPAGDADREPGFFVLMPFELTNGGVVLVNRGFIAQSKTGAGAWRSSPAGTTTITGWLRAPQSRNAFTPADDPGKGQWYTSDPLKIAAALGLVDPAPFVLQQENPPGNEDGLFRTAPDVSEIPNNHLSYAVTWFGLAAALAIIFAFYAKSRVSPP
ncbi:MAG: SURF1 family protein [Methylocystis sp.]